jgi:hypothetical protein
MLLPALSRKTCGVSWQSLVSIAHRAPVARALCALLCSSEACCLEAARRAAGARLASAVGAMMQAAEGGGDTGVAAMIAG